MTSREIVIESILHREPGRVPVDMGSTPSSGISAIAYGNLVRHLGLDRLPVRIYDVVQQLAQPDEEILDRFGIDAVDIGRTFNREENDWYEIRLSDGNKAFYPSWFRPVEDGKGGWIGLAGEGEEIARMPARSTFFDQTFFPWAGGYPDGMKGLDEAMERVLWSAFVHSPWDNSGMPGFWDELRARGLKLRQESDRAIVVTVGCNLFEWGTFIRRMDQFMTDLYLEPDNVHALLDALMERHMTSLGKVCHYLGDVADVVRFGDDLGGMNGPFMDTSTYREFFKPRHKELCSYVKQNSKMHTFLHSCGSIYSLIPDLIGAGFEILNPVQTACRDMDPVRLKMEFGREVTFWGGGIETTKTLNNGSPEEIRRETLERLETLGRGGGFVFNTVHNILPDVPPGNIAAMFEAIGEFNAN